VLDEQRGGVDEGVRSHIGKPAIHYASCAAVSKM
jgi:hypothetical protein